MPHAFDWAKIATAAQAFYNWQVACVGIATVLGFVFKSRIGRRFARTMHALQSASAASRRIETLETKLQESEAARGDWQDRFDEIEARYKALGAEYEKLGEDITEIRKRMTTAEDEARMLLHDRDVLLTYSRLLVGQLNQGGATPAYPWPSLKSIGAIPGPARPEDQMKL